MILAGDVGGTHTRLALFENGKMVSPERTFSSREFPGLEEIIREFLQKVSGKPASACIGIAGPVRGGVCQATNLPWVVDSAKLARDLSLPFALINDLEANAYGLNVLKPEEFLVLNQGIQHKGNRALIAAGTGLGEAGMYWDGKEHYPFACEGGHADFAARDAEEFELYLYLKKKFSHVSYERVVSGPGLCSLYQFFVDTGREKRSPQVMAEMEKKNPSYVISEWGKLDKDPACSRAIDWFLSFYGAEAGNLALKFLSFGGLFIGGGIAPHLAEKMKQGRFFSSFCDKGRFKPLLETIPVRVILNDNAALLGAAYYAEKKR